MADKSFDVVVIGGGHQGLVISNYMAMNGMTVGLFEQHNELGGGGATMPSPAPGFLGNPHAHLGGFFTNPAYQDFKLYEKGLEFAFPEVATSMMFPDETALVVYNATEFNWEKGELSPKLDVIEKNLKELARISPRDAERLFGYATKIDKWGKAFRDCQWNPPPLPGEPDPIEALFDDPEAGFDRRYCYMTAMEVVCDLFDSAKVRTYVLRQLASSGVYPEDVTVPILTILKVMILLGVNPAGIFVGGTHNVTHALQRALSEQGGKFLVGSDVDQILVDNGCARGIRLADGTEIEAKKLVITSIEIKQTLGRHLRDVDIDAEIRRKVDNLRTDRANLFWGHIAFHELPEYKAATWNPDCGKCNWAFMGEPDLDYLYRQYRFRHQNLTPGNWPEKLFIWESTVSQWDSSYAPPGKHVALIEEMAPPASWLTERDWLQLKKEATGQILKEWQKYAPNMTWDNVIASHIETPLDAEQRSANFVDGCYSLTAHTPSQWYHFRPTRELAQYQVPGIDDFYMASGSCHFSYGLLGMAAYNCYKRIAQNLGLRKPWEEQGRPY